MPPRAYWKGYLKLSLISIPVRMYSASESSKKITLNQIDKASKQRVRQQTFSGEEPVARSDIVKGYEYEKGKNVLIDDEDLDKIKLETDKTIEITQFINERELEPLCIGSHYYMGPDGPVADDPFRVIREALKQTKTIGIGRVVMHGREQIVSLSTRDKGFVLTTLRYANEIRSSDAYFEDIKNGDVDEGQLQLAVQLIESLSKPFDHSEHKDRYQEALLALINARIAGTEPVVVQEAEAPKVINFMDALKRSVADSPAKKKPPAPSVRTKKAARTKKKA